jgi:hypothetical protein
VKLSILVAFLSAGLGVAAGSFLLQPAQAQGESKVADGRGIIVTGTAGDLQNVNNLIYVVYRRPLTEREKTYLTAIDKDFPEERVTLCVYRMNQNGAKDEKGAPGKLLYMRDVTWDCMILGSEQSVADAEMANRDELHRLTKRAEKEKAK